VKVLIFDFDGTIADSFHAVLAISNRLAREFGYDPVHPDDIDQLKNLSSREILRLSGVSPFRLPFLLGRLQRELNREICQLQPIPGISEVLQLLKQQEYRLGIVTSNSRENVAAFLEAHALRSLFDFIGTGLTVFGKGGIIRRILRQQRIDPATVVYVGDEIRDIEAARKIGIRVIAVSWGFNSQEALAAHHPDFLIHRPEELLDVVAGRAITGFVSINDHPQHPN
jgi:phosphoglycolate phosphatase-like HAD superfamily hydrolase